VEFPAGRHPVPVLLPPVPTAMSETVRPPTESLPLDPADAKLIASWSAALRARGRAVSSIQRAAKRLRAFARGTRNGLLQATREDVARFAMERAGGQGLESLIRSDTWRKSADALHNFYAWAERRRLLSRRHNPIRGIRRPLPVSTNGAVDGATMRKYDKLLHCPRASRRDRAVLWLLAHGMTPAEVTRLRTADVDLERREVHVRVPGRACRSRIVPLSENAVAALSPSVLPRMKFGHTWVFQGAQRGHPRPHSSSDRLSIAWRPRYSARSGRTASARESLPVAFVTCSSPEPSEAALPPTA
jgi:integrase